VARPKIRPTGSVIEVEIGMRRKSGSHRGRRVDHFNEQLRFGRLEGVPQMEIPGSDWRESERERKNWPGPRAGIRGYRSMAKELRTAAQLSDMIVSALGVRDLDIEVRKDHAYGWQPTVVASPGDLIGYQRRVEEIANRLRFQFALRE
jgi:hypothetical protein